MTISAILLILAIVGLIATLPAWPYSRSWGYLHTGILGLVIVFLLLAHLIGSF
ncbi:DUF3309 family protein [Antarcticirhabdus aurantiaca]|uniref:DUF3309 family protein n=1 Tax=Antarcticirhabdus aurantiaca TaxID=2606717 RepID=A0ACD4NTG8_9HYPH|nr:DUF3309 family protein [Antarcticirhabdus aurantiaca]WAJ30196.1 DUF3309 family protein [Jeongeuplla avenae]